MSLVLLLLLLLVEVVAEEGEWKNSQAPQLRILVVDVRRLSTGECWSRQRFNQVDEFEEYRRRFCIIKERL